MNDVPSNPRPLKKLGQILAALEREPRVLAPAQMKRFHARMREEGLVPQRRPFDDLLFHLEQAGAVRRAQLEPDEEEYKPIVRFVRGDASPFLLGQSLRPGSYLSHGTAVYLHALTQQLPKTIFVNKEQSAKPEKAALLSQAAINRAFANEQRSSRFALRWEDRRYVLLSGKNTKQLEVVAVQDPYGEAVMATSLERTLVDIAVRPSYAGGPYEVLEAYRAAQGRASINSMVSILRRLNHAYPYHQAIGFYLERAGFPADRVQRFLSMGLDYDFYLANKMPETDFVPKWRLFVPKGF